MKELEIINFSEKEWKEIPDQDNPAFTHLFVDNYKKNRCLMIVKSPEHHKIGVPHGFKVLEIDNPENKGDRVLSLGVFYTYENSLLFATTYGKSVFNQPTEARSGE